MGKSIEEARQLASAYRDCAGMLPPLRRMLDVPGDRLTRGEEDRSANDAAVFAAFDELWPLATQTKAWLEWAADEARGVRAHVDEADEAALGAAVAEIEPLHAAARTLLAEAVDPLDVAQRAALGRHMVSELDYPDRLWAPAAERDRAELAGTLRPDQAAVHSRLNWYVDGQLEHFRSKRLARWAPRVSCDAEQVPERVKQPIPRFRIPRRYPLKRRWMDLLQPLQAIEARGAELHEAYQRLRHAQQQAGAQRRRAAHEAERRRRQREKEAERARRADEAERAGREADDLRERYDAFVRAWWLSSQQLRNHGWEATLLRRLTDSDGIHDDDGELVTDALTREGARHVLAVLALAGDHGDAAGAHLREQLATEDGLFRERARLLETMADLPVSNEARAKLANLHPDLRRASEWLVHHMGEVLPVLEASAPTEGRALRQALGEVQRGAEA